MVSDCIPKEYFNLVPKIVSSGKERSGLYPPISIVNSMIEEFFKRRR
jgi:hypothetical protein